MYQELRKDNLTIELDSKFSYTWKRSSLLYEMWCYFKICRILMTSYKIENESWNISIEGRFLFPFLEEGTSVTFNNDEYSMDLIYDKALPLNGRKTSISQPLYIAKTQENRNHNRPDILLNVYLADRSVYCGSIIFECKYRKLRSFWGLGERSSKGQLEAYYNNARSSILFNGFGGMLNMRPVQRVVVLTPDELGEGETGEDFNILIKQFKPDDTGRFYDSISTLINDEIQDIHRKRKCLTN